MSIYDEIHTPLQLEDGLNRCPNAFQEGPKQQVRYQLLFNRGQNVQMLFFEVVT